MISDFPMMVDACVLVQAAVRDTLLRLFERRLFWPGGRTNHRRDSPYASRQATQNTGTNRTPRQRVAQPFLTEQGYRELIPAMTLNFSDAVAHLVSDL